MKLIDVAQTWVNNGYTVIPLVYRSKKPLIFWEPYQDRAPSHTELLQWFPSEMRNIGLVIKDNLVVIDFDVQEVFDYWYSLYPINTYMIKTRRGVHVYIKTSQPTKNYHSELLDIKSERGYVLIPPSIHPSGYQYQILCENSITQYERLEDVLPASFMPAPELAGREIVSQVSANVDPWDLADSATEITSNLINQIHQSVSILQLLPRAERSSRDGRWYVALCPFHDDHTPSFWIDTRRGLCGCRKCNIKEMDVINLYARLNHISNVQALRELAKII